MASYFTANSAGTAYLKIYSFFFSSVEPFSWRCRNSPLWHSRGLCFVVIRSCLTWLSSELRDGSNKICLFSSIMACAYKAPVAFLEGMETLEPMGSLGHLGSRDGMGWRGRRASACARASRSPGHPTSSSAPGAPLTTASTSGRSR